MRTRHVVALVIGILLIIPALGLVLGGGAIGVYELAARDDGGWHAVDIDRLASDGVAVTTPEAAIDLSGPAGLVDWVDLDFRFRASSTTAGDTFIGLARTADLQAYIGGARHDEVTTVDLRGVPTYRHVAGATGAVAAPATQDFWAAEVQGPGMQELDWTASTGRWSMVVMNASGAPGVSVTGQGAVRSGALLTVAVVLVILGVLLAIIGTVLVVLAVRARGKGMHPYDTPTPVAWTALPPPDAPVGAASDRPYAGYAGYSGYSVAPVPSVPAHPLMIEARIAPALSRWLWLVKWFLAIPHFFALVFLWVALAVTTVVAWFAILFTGAYPRSLFDFNVGVLRWTWRVSHYCGTGGLGTDRYPPFTLQALPDDDTRLDVAYPERLSRGLIFVKWLLLLPHWIIIALIAGTQSRTTDEGVRVGGWPGVLGVLVFVAGVVLLVTGSMNRGLFDVIIGLNRWTYRVTVYALLMTDVYPPFRYDGGANEPALTPPPGPMSPPTQAPPPVGSAPPPTQAPPPVQAPATGPPVEPPRESVSQ